MISVSRVPLTVASCCSLALASENATTSFTAASRTLTAELRTSRHSSFNFCPALTFCSGVIAALAAWMPGSQAAKAVLKRSAILPI